MQKEGSKHMVVDINELTIEEKIGQMIIVGIDSNIIQKELRN